MTSRHTALTAVVAALLASGATTAALASGRDHPEDDGTTTATTTVDDRGPAPSSPPTAPRASRTPRIVEVEVDDVDGRPDLLRLRAEVRRRGAAVTRVDLTYRGERYAARRVRGTSRWVRTVTAHPADRVDDALVRVRARACAGSACSTRTVVDDA